MVQRKLPKNLPIKLIIISAITLCVILATLGLVLTFGATSSSETAKQNNNSPNDTSSSSSLSVTSTPAPTPASCDTFNPVSDRTWLQIVKDPDSHAGECIIVYGEVTQFDSATGTDTFRADVGGTAQTPNYGFVAYPTNTILTGNSQDLSEVVQGDLFKANVEVVGSETYDSQLGGKITTPELEVYTISNTGHLSN